MDRVPAVAGEGPLVTFLETVAPVMSQVRADDVAGVLGGIISDVDRAALTGEFADFMSDMIRRSLSAGIAGWRDDILASLHDWGFNPAANTTPVFVWHGEQDRMVPYQHGRWLCAHIPGAIARLFPGEGHLSLAVTRIGEIVQELATSIQ
jgi:pimeloyl-ACP methyl ester carboxylesterase